LADCANAFGLLRVVPDPAFGSMRRNGAFQHPEHSEHCQLFGDTMERFVTLDGRYLLFNDRSYPSPQPCRRMGWRFTTMHESMGNS
jgi:hypothetical protein